MAEVELLDSTRRLSYFWEQLQANQMAERNRRISNLREQLQQANQMAERNRRISNLREQLQQVIQMAEKNRSMMFSREYLHPKQITKQNSNREQEALSEREEKYTVKNNLARLDARATRIHRSMTIFRMINDQEAARHRLRASIVHRKMARMSRRCLESVSDEALGDKPVPHEEVPFHLQGGVTAAVQNGPRNVFVKWVLGSGASMHMTGNADILQGLYPADPITPTAANGQAMRSDSCGRVVGGVNLSGVRHFPGATMNLISTDLLDHQSCKISQFDPAAGKDDPKTPDIWYDCNSEEMEIQDNLWPSQSDPTADKDGPNRADPLTTWLVDCGATHHMTGNPSLLLDSGYSPVDDGNGVDIFFHQANGEVPLRVHGSGSVRTESIALDDVWYVPGLDSNVVSTGQLARQGCAITLAAGGCRVTRGVALVGSARFTDSDQFELDFLKVASSSM